MDIAILEGYALQSLLDALATQNERGDVYRLRISVEDGLKFKINEGCWSPPVGRMADPSGY